MTDPSKERIAAALRLADTCNRYNEGPHDGGEYERALSAYRATLPRIRSRAEIDAEIAALARAEAAERDGYTREQALTATCDRLAEATARFEELQRCCDRGVQHRATLDALETLLLRWTERSCEASNLAAACLELMHATPAPTATAEPENPEADERHAKLVAVADKLRASRALVERIEAECNNKLLCAGDLADNILELIRAAKEGA